MMPVLFKLPQISLSAGAEVRASDTSMKQLPLQSDDGKHLYLARSRYRVQGSVTVGAASNVVRLARLFSLFRIRLEGLGIPLWDVTGRELNIQGMVDRAGMAAPQRDRVDTTVTSTLIKTDDVFGGLSTNGTGGSIAFDVEFVVDWKKLFARRGEDYAWPAAVARCFEHDITLSALSSLSESGTLVTALTSPTLDIVHELEARDELQFPKVITVSAQALSGEQPTDITAFDGSYRSMVLISNVNDYFANNVLTELQVKLGNLDLVPKKTDVFYIYDRYREMTPSPSYVQDHTEPAAAAAFRNQYLPIVAPAWLDPQRSTEQLDARAPVEFVITAPANFKLLRSIEHNWNDAMLDHVISKTGLDPAQLTVKPVTASKKPIEGPRASRGYPFKVVGQRVDFTKKA